MNKKTVVSLLLLTLIIIVKVPGSFALPSYVTNVTAVYGSDSCNTCHVITQGSGMHDFNGTGSSNGTYEPRNNRTPGQRNRTNGTRNFDRKSGMDNSNRTFPLNSYGTLFESQPDHATDPGAALIAIGSPQAATTNDTPEDTAPAGNPAAPGFEIVAAIVGLFAYALVAKRHNK